MLAVAALVSAPLTDDLLLLRVLVVATAVGAASSAVLLRMRERAGEAELEAEVSARSRDEGRFEDRIAELEFQVETAEEQTRRLDRRLLAQRSQLTRAEADIQRLLRERARTAAEHAAREAEQARRQEAAKRGIRPTASAYLRAASALRTLERRAAFGRPLRSSGPGLSRSVELSLAKPALAEPGPARAPEAAKPQLPVREQSQPQVTPEPRPEQRPQVAAEPAAAELPIVAQGPAWARAALPPLRPAVSILPATLQRGGVRGPGSAHGTAAGTFSFFSRQEGAISTDLSRAPADLADVVGEEAAAEQDRYQAVSRAAGPAAAEAVVPAHTDAAPAVHGRGPDPAAPAGERGQLEGGEDELVDLTAEDETEPIDVRVLRAL
ncbi:hypothetical protein GXW82_35880 [Streptacidiphilus sp. 4-A2]|nr:hypothetical protein [Streptacidiphilus sp. 4-A2]